MGQQREDFLASGKPDAEFERFTFALERVRRRFPHMTLGTFATFLSIARHGGDGGISPTQLGLTLGQPLPTVYRQCNQLTDGLPGKPGMKLVRKVGDDNDARSRKLFISLLGLALLSEIKDILSAELPDS